MSLEVIRVRLRAGEEAVPVDRRPVRPLVGDAVPSGTESVHLIAGVMPVYVESTDNTDAHSQYSGEEKAVESQRVRPNVRSSKYEHLILRPPVQVLVAAARRRILSLRITGRFDLE